MIPQIITKKTKTNMKINVKSIYKLTIQNKKSKTSFAW